MKLLFVASECAPFIKTGGLADVIGAVPKAVAPLGADVRVLLPAYPALAKLTKVGRKVLEFKDLYGGPARVILSEAEGITLLLVDAPHLFDRPGNIYLDESGHDWSDNAFRFGALSRAGAEIASGALGKWAPDIVHAHDWQAGLVSAFLHDEAKRPPVVLTIHNIAFQGLFDYSVLGQLGLPQSLFTSEGLEYFGRLNFLKGGIALADRITTVSPTYARELMSPEFGMGMEGLLNARKGDLAGILNGIDTSVWDPETDPALPSNYSARALTAKKANRREVARRFGLKLTSKTPLLCVISRLTSQKGLDLLLENLPHLVGSGGKLALLGSGDKELEHAFVQATGQYQGSVGVVIGYDEDLSHLLQGGSDAILIPSRFEPCGLTQLYGLRYGTLPIVARTGGLADTVIDANEAALGANCATGIQFAPVTAPALGHAIDRAIGLFRQPRVWNGMVRRAMRQQVGWDRSAAAYMSLYESLIKA